MLKTSRKSIRPMSVKGTAVFVCAAFILTSVCPIQARAEVSPAPVVSYRSLADDLTSIALPQEIGNIQETYRGASDKIVVLIRDAHSIPDAQRSIQGAIDHFQTKYGISLVGLEGASEKLDPQIFRSFPDKDLLRRTFDAFAAKGELTGGTAAALFNPSPGIYRGIEDWPLYEEGVFCFLRAMAKENEIMAVLDPVAAELRKEKETIYSKELLEIDRALADFSENRTAFAQVLDRLGKYQRPPKGSELAVLLAEVRRNGTADTHMETEIKKVAEQVESCLKEQVSSPETQQELREFNGRHQEFRTGRTTPQAFALYLRDLTEKHRISTKVSRELARLAEDQKRLRDIEGTLLFGEFKHYADSITEKMIADSPPGIRNSIRLLNARAKDLELLRRLARLELSFEDWGRVRDMMLRPGSQGGAVDRGEIPALLQKMEPHLAFYRVAEKRDQVFLKNIQSMMAENGKTNSLLVAGGFHTEGLTRVFREKGISYVLVTPRIGSVPAEPLYREHMQGQVSWSDHFEIKDGKVNLYDAFVRGTRDKLLGDKKASARSGKEWRDQIIRDLAAEGRITQASEYTRFIDETTKPDGGGRMEDVDRLQTLRKQWLSNIDRFGEGLKKLRDEGRLSESGILQLIRTITTAEPALAGALANRSVNVGLLPSLKVAAPARSEARASGVPEGAEGDWRVTFPEVTFNASQFSGQNKARSEAMDAADLFVKGFLLRTPQAGIEEIFSRIAKRPVSLSDLTKEIVVSYQDEGAHKIVFKVVIKTKDEKNLSLKLAMKKVKKADEISIEETEALNLISEYTDAVPIFGGRFELNGESFYLEEFIEGKTVRRILQEGKLTTEIRRRSVEAILKTAREWGAVPTDVNLKNVMIRDSDGSAVLVDIGTRYEGLGDCLLNLVEFYGFLHGDPGDNRFIFKIFIDVLGPKAGLATLKANLREIAEQSVAPDRRARQMSLGKVYMRDRRLEPPYKERNFEKILRELRTFIADTETKKGVPTTTEKARRSEMRAGRVEEGDVRKALASDPALDRYADKIIGTLRLLENSYRYSSYLKGLLLDGSLNEAIIENKGDLLKVIASDPDLKRVFIKRFFYDTSRQAAGEEFGELLKAIAPIPELKQPVIEWLAARPDIFYLWSRFFMKTLNPDLGDADAARIDKTLQLLGDPAGYPSFLIKPLLDGSIRGGDLLKAIASAPELKQAVMEWFAAHPDVFYPNAQFFLKAFNPAMDVHAERIKEVFALFGYPDVYPSFLVRPVLDGALDKVIAKSNAELFRAMASDPGLRKVALEYLRRHPRVPSAALPDLIGALNSGLGAYADRIAKVYGLLGEPGFLVTASLDEQSGLDKVFSGNGSVGIDTFIERVLDPASAVATEHKVAMLDFLITYPSSSQERLDILLNALSKYDPKGEVYFRIADVIAGKYSEDHLTLPGNLKQALDKVSRGQMDINDPTHLLANYMGIIKAFRSWGMKRQITYQEYTAIIDGTRNKTGGALQIEGRDMKEEIIRNLWGLVYEASLVREEILRVRERAKELGRKTVVLANGSYGKAATDPITTGEASGNPHLIDRPDIPVWYPNVGSTESHQHEFILNEDLFTPEQLKMLVEESPWVTVVDGSRSVGDRAETTPHIPDAFKGYRNFFMVLDQALYGTVDPAQFYVDADFAKALMETSAAQSLIKKIRAMPVKPRAPDAYKLRFWYERKAAAPRKEFLYLRVNMAPVTPVPPLRDVNAIDSPTCLVIQSILHPDDIPPGMEKYEPGFFDDKTHFKDLHLKYEEGYGLVPSKQYVDLARELFRKFMEENGRPPQDSAARSEMRDAAKTVAGVAGAVPQKDLALGMTDEAFAKLPKKEKAAHLYRIMQAAIAEPGVLFNLHLNVSGWLVYMGQGTLQAITPRPDGENLRKPTSFGAVENLQEIYLTEIEKRDNGKLYLTFSYVTKKGKSGTAVAYWNEEKQTYESIDIEKRDDLVRKIQDALRGKKFTGRLNVSGWLVGMRIGRFQTTMPRPDGKNLKKPASFGAVTYLSRIVLQEIKYEEGRLQLKFEYWDEEGQYGWTRVVWDPKKETYTVLENSAPGLTVNKLKGYVLEDVGTMFLRYLKPEADLKVKPAVKSAEGTTLWPDAVLDGQTIEFKFGKWRDDITDSINKYSLALKLPVNEGVLKEVDDGNPLVVSTLSDVPFNGKTITPHYWYVPMYRVFDENSWNPAVQYFRKRFGLEGRKGDEETLKKFKNAFVDLKTLMSANIHRKEMLEILDGIRQLTRKFPGVTDEAEMLECLDRLNARLAKVLKKMPQSSLVFDDVDQDGETENDADVDDEINADDGPDILDRVIAEREAALGSETQETVQYAAQGEARSEMRSLDPAREAEAREFLASRIDISKLEKNFGGIIKEYGYAGFEYLWRAGGEKAQPLFQYGLPAIKKLFSPGELRNYWPELVRLGVAAGGGAGDLFQYGLPAVKNLITDRRSLRSVGKELVRLSLAAGENAWPLFKDGLPAVKEIITDQRSLGFVGDELVLLNEAAGRGAGYLFKFYLPSLRKVFGRAYFIRQWPELHKRILAIYKLTNNDNRQRMLELLLGKFPVLIKNKGPGFLGRALESLSWKFPALTQDKGPDFLEVLDLAIEVLSKENRLCFQILEGIYDGIEKGVLENKDLGPGKDLIFDFIGMTHSFSPSLFGLYKRDGRGALEKVFAFSGKILTDDVGEAELAQLETYFRSQGVRDVDEAVVASIQIAIPSSGSSYVKRKEIVGLYKKYRRAGDKRTHVPAALAGRDFGRGEEKTASPVQDLALRTAVLEFRVVKGIPYGFWGLQAGVCIATDIALWKKKEFFLLAMIDKKTQKTVGFIHLFEKEIDNGRILTVPGIEPSVEFLSEVKAVDVYPQIEEALIRVAEAGGYAGLYVPTSKNILSNRSDIFAIASKNYSSKKNTIVNSKGEKQTVKWNTLPQLYPFSRVYTVWQKKVPPARSEQRMQTASLRELAGPVADLLKPGSKGGELGRGAARQIEAVVVRGELDVLIEAVKRFAEEQMAKAEVEVAAGASAATVQVTKETADAMVQRVLEALKANGIKSNLTVIFDVSPDRNFTEALRALKDRIGTAVFTKENGPILDRKALEGVTIQTVPNLKGYKPLAAENTGAVPVLSQDLGSDYFSNEVLFGIGLDAGNIRGEPFLEVVENVVRIASGLLMAGRIRSPEDLKDPAKIAEIKAELAHILFKMDTDPGILTLEGRNLIVHRGLLQKFILEYQASSAVQKAA